jgi:hypothetical protein
LPFLGARGNSQPQNPKSSLAEVPLDPAFHVAPGLVLAHSVHKKLTISNYVAFCSCEDNVAARKNSDLGIVVTVDDSHLARIQSIAGQLADLGVRKMHTSEVLGVITGEAPLAAFSQIRQMEGVADVEKERSVHAISEA